MAAVSLPLFPAPAAPPPRAPQGGLAQAEPAAEPPAEPPSAQALLAAPERVHPGLWRAHQLGRGSTQGVSSGFAALDAELPGHGWPRAALTELLLAQPGIGELRLMAPALRQVMAAGRSVMLFDPPSPLCAPGWLQLGLDLQQLVLVQGKAGVRGRARELLPQADVLWALEQALKSGHVGAVLAWLPARLRTDALRRLQLAAHAHDGPVFLLREAATQSRPSPAPLRLLLQARGPDELSVRLLKRRGPALDRPLRLALPPVLPDGVHTGLQAVRRLQVLQAAAAATATLA